MAAYPGVIMTSLGYMRVSTEEQTLDLQKDALEAAGVLPCHVYQDTASGKRDDRPGLEACLKALREGDTLVVWKLDRLGRSLQHLVTTVYDLQKRGIGFRVLTGAPIDTSTPAGELVFAIFAGLAQFERSLIIERTRAGLASARARGRVGGRKPSLSKDQVHYASVVMGRPDCCVKELAEKLKVNPSTLYSYVHADGTPTPKGEKFMEDRK